MQRQIAPGRSYGLAEWCALRGFSRTTGWRLLKDGEIRTLRFVANAATTGRQQKAYGTAVSAAPSRSKATPCDHGALPGAAPLNPATGAATPRPKGEL